MCMESRKDCTTNGDCLNKAEWIGLCPGTLGIRNPEIQRSYWGTDRRIKKKRLVMRRGVNSSASQGYYWSDSKILRRSIHTGSPHLGIPQISWETSSQSEADSPPYEAKNSLDSKNRRLKAPCKAVTNKLQTIESHRYLGIIWPREWFQFSDRFSCMLSLIGEPGNFSINTYEFSPQVRWTGSVR